MCNHRPSPFFICNTIFCGCTRCKNCKKKIIPLNRVHGFLLFGIEFFFEFSVICNVIAIIKRGLNTVTFIDFIYVFVGILGVIITDLIVAHVVKYWQLK